LSVAGETKNHGQGVLPVVLQSIAVFFSDGQQAHWYKE
jgi:hypothetical protein